MLKNKKFKLVLFPENSSKMIKEFKLNLHGITLKFLVTCLFFGVVGTITFNYVRDYFRQDEILKLRQENEKLVEQFNSVNSKLAELQGEFKNIKTRENELRDAVKLPAVSEIEPLEQEKIYDLQEVNSEDYPTYSQTIMERLSNFGEEVQNTQKDYERIEDKFKENIDIVANTPSINPVPQAKISDYFGRRIDPFTGQIKQHNGLDFHAPKGTPIYASADGKVTFSGFNGNYGKFIRIKHKYGYETAYGHLSISKVKQGQKIKKNDLIGFVGSTGRTTGPHLHYEIKLNGRFLNPLNYIGSNEQDFTSN
ncbi:peptidoglycan DD-metalloendopeptidase family protein [bacterium]|nr:peptidoglycan DD-metalloendopeptidase family protein [bacterium]